MWSKHISSNVYLFTFHNGCVSTVQVMGCFSTSIVYHQLLKIIYLYIYSRAAIAPFLFPIIVYLKDSTKSFKHVLSLHQNTRETKFYRTEVACLYITLLWVNFHVKYCVKIVNHFATLNIIINRTKMYFKCSRTLNEIRSQSCTEKCFIIIIHASRNVTNLSCIMRFNAAR